MHDSAVASVSPRSRSSSSTSAGVSISSREKRCAGHRLEQLRLELVGARLGARGDEQIDVDLRLAGADRHLDPLPVPAGRRESLRHRRLGDAVEAEHAPLGRLCPGPQPLQGLRLEHARPELLELAWRPGKRDDDARAHLEHDGRRGADQPDPECARRAASPAS